MWQSEHRGALNNHLSIAEIADGMVAARRNAAELMQDAALLAEASSGARSFTLMYTACEELAKFFMLEIAGKRLSLGHNLNWKRFWQRYRSHDSKLAQAEVRLISGGDLDQLTSLPLAGLSPTIRNGSLYSDRGPSGSFRSPSEIDWMIPNQYLSASAHDLLQKARVVGAGQPEIIAYLAAAPIAEAREGNLAALVVAMKLARDAGVTREKLEAKMAQLFGEAPDSPQGTTSSK